MNVNSLHFNVLSNKLEKHEKNPYCCKRIFFMCFLILSLFASTSFIFQNHANGQSINSSIPGSNNSMQISNATTMLNNNTQGIQFTGKSTVSSLSSPPQTLTAQHEQTERKPLIPPNEVTNFSNARSISESKNLPLTATTNSAFNKNIVSLALPNQTSSNTTSSNNTTHAMSLLVPQPNIATNGVGFNGLTQGQSGGWTPPDVAVAVGPHHILQMVNLAGQINMKDGTPVAGPFPLTPFFNAPAQDQLSDPYLVYDTSNDRFFASILDITSNSVRVAVSQTNDPNGTWNTFNFVFAGCPDQPFIATSSDKFAVGGNVFANNCTGGFIGTQNILVKKSDLISGSPSPLVQISTPDSAAFSEHPVKTFGSDQRMIFVSVSLGDRQNAIKTITYNGQVPSAVRSISSAGPISTTAVPPRAVQPGTTTLVETNDGRIMSAMMAPDNKMIWVAFNDACKPTGDTQIRSCAHVVQFDSSNHNSIVQDVKLGIAHTYIYYPALTLLRSGNLVIEFAASSSTIFPSLYATGQVLGATGNTFDPVKLIKQGSSPNTSGRYGDYQGATIEADPQDVHGAWISGEYNSVSNWSTFIIKVIE